MGTEGNRAIWVHFERPWGWVRCVCVVYTISSVSYSYAPAGNVTQKCGIERRNRWVRGLLFERAERERLGIEISPLGFEVLVSYSSLDEWALR